MKALLKIILLLVLSYSVNAQSIEGYWEGGIIRTGNSLQLMKVDFFHEKDSLRASITIPDWPAFESETTLVDVKKDVIRFQTSYGEAILVQDTIYKEMVGVIGQSNPPLNLHLKRSIPSGNASFTRKKLSLNSIDYKPENYVYLPDNAAKQSLSCIIIIPGRGCSGWEGSVGLAETFARNGYAAFIYAERGATSSKIDCNTVTLEEETDDLYKFKTALGKVKQINPDKIGAFTNSAGSWSAVKLSEKTSLAFIITYVGPVTSIKQQQYDGLRAFAKEENYKKEHLEQAIEYTNILYKKKIDSKDLERARTLLDSADKNGWINWLDESDVLRTKEDFQKLWVQRYQYDPTPELINFKQPYLAIFGENDPIVPYKIQINHFDSITSISGNTNVEYKIIKEGSHGINEISQVRNLGYNEGVQSTPYYYKFFRSGALPVIYILEFLKKYDF